MRIWFTCEIFLIPAEPRASLVIDSGAATVAISWQLEAREEGMPMAPVVRTMVGGYNSPGRCCRG